MAPAAKQARCDPDEACFTPIGRGTVGPRHRFQRAMGRIASTFPAIVAAMLCTACSDTAPVADAFERTGELVALSGGDAGAANACIGCHGLAGEGDGHLAPRLAGLDPGYIVRQLELYDVGQRRHTQMEAIAGRLSWDARVQVAQYYGALEVPAPPRAIAAACTPTAADVVYSGDAALGLPACAACHGSTLGGAGAGAPPLAGLTAAYIEEQLRAWRTGRRYGDPQDAMGRVSRQLHARDLAAVAACAANPPGATDRPAPRAASLPGHRPDPRSGA